MTIVNLVRHETTTSVGTFKHLAMGPLRKMSISERLALLVLDDAAEANTILKMSELAETLGLSRAALTSLADRLTRSGMLMRVPSATDRRVTEIEITPNGRQVMRDAMSFELDAVPA